MNDKQPPLVPKLKESFQEAHDGKKKDDIPVNSDGIITKKGIEELEKTIKRTTPQIHLTPSGTVQTRGQDEQRLVQLDKMKQKMKQRSAKTRDDFGRSVEM